jgi:hypothetical protein
LIALAAAFGLQNVKQRETVRLTMLSDERTRKAAAVQDFVFKFRHAAASFLRQSSTLWIMPPLS